MKKCILSLLIFFVARTCIALPMLGPVSDSNGWQQVMTFPKTAVIETSVKMNDNLVVLTSFSGAYVSADDGKTWQLAKGFPRVTPSSEESKVYTVISDGMLYASFLGYDDKRVLLPESGLYYSEDSGKSWTRDKSLEGQVVALVSVHSIVYAQAWTNNYEQQVFYKANKKSPWAPLAEQPPVPEGSSLSGLVAVGQSLLAKIVNLGWPSNSFQLLRLGDNQWEQVAVPSEFTFFDSSQWPNLDSVNGQLILSLESASSFAGLACYVSEDQGDHWRPYQEAIIPLSNDGNDGMFYGADRNGSDLNISLYARHRQSQDWGKPKFTMTNTDETKLTMYLLPLTVGHDLLSGKIYFAFDSWTGQSTLIGYGLWRLVGVM